MTQPKDSTVSTRHNRGIDTLRPLSMSALRKSDVPVLTVKEVAGLFNCDQRTVSQALTQGAL
ncbi:hypothetical protein, partial [Rhodococcus sp. NPDC058514]|uniref:hypothetical protein n=1 Tax=Rhodococcus sp. NPDC058514 TaxID=3346532 RepID=UPI00364D412F